MKTKTPKDTAFKEYLYENFAESNLKPSKLKSIEDCENQARQEIDLAFDEYLSSLGKGLELYGEKTLPEEKADLETIMQKLNKKKSKNTNSEFLIDLEEVAFLDKIARREIAHHHYEEANLMYRWMLSFVPTFNLAWIGVAIAEQQLNHISDAEEIYSLAMQILPDDYLLHSFAAEFFLSQKNPGKAKEILNELMERMTQEGLTDTEDCKHLKEELAHIA